MQKTAFAREISYRIGNRRYRHHGNRITPGVEVLNRTLVTRGVVWIEADSQSTTSTFASTGVGSGRVGAGCFNFGCFRKIEMKAQAMPTEPAMMNAAP
jgi:hypothetical protein